MQSFLDEISVALNPSQLEVLGEKALQEGIIDILIKEVTAVPSPKKIAIEVKSNIATMEDLMQLKAYLNTLGRDCLKGVLIAAAFQKSVMKRASESNVVPVKYDVSFGPSPHATFESLVQTIHLSKAV